MLGEPAKSSIRQAKLMIMHSQLDMRESWGNGQHKVQEEYEALAQGHGGTKKGLPELREDSQHGYQMQKGAN